MKKGRNTVVVNEARFEVRLSVTQKNDGRKTLYDPGIVTVGLKTIVG